MSVVYFFLNATFCRSLEADGGDPEMPCVFSPQRSVQTSSNMHQEAPLLDQARSLWTRTMNLKLLTLSAAILLL